MIGPWLEARVSAEVVTPLHVGAGASGVVKGARSLVERSTGVLDAAPEDVEVALVVADADGAPVIPGSSLKGAARRLFPRDAAERELLFGPEAIVAPEDARAGRLTIFPARLANPSRAEAEWAPYAYFPLPDPVEGPVAARNRSHWEVGLFIESRTALDPAWGTAAEGRLFHRQMVAPGAVFTIRLGLVRPDEAGRDALLRLLAALPQGVSLGAGAGDDHGRLRVQANSLHVLDRRVAAGKGLEVHDVTAEWTKRLAGIDAPAPTIRPARSTRLRLVRKGPFLVNDAFAGHARAEATRAAPEADEAAATGAGVPPPHLQGLRALDADQETPRLPASSLRGALRALARWRQLLEPEGWGDDPDKVYDARRDVALSPSEVLFGVAGWRGLIRIEEPVCAGFAGWEELTSVRIDRFGGGPVDGGLFAVRAAVDPVFETTLSVASRGTAPDKACLALFDAVVKELVETGLELGHATNRGFGWFDAEPLA